jgi:predicted phage baseplate assembly protein
MPIRPPALDDRRFQDLVDEVVRRIPAHTPEWTNPRPGDPGRTLIELFAWLTDTILYRANLIPERQRLVFLSLLGIPLRPAQAARGLVAISLEGQPTPKAVTMRPLARVDGPSMTFETLSETTVLPVTGECYIKQPLSQEQEQAMRDLLAGLGDLYNLDGEPEAYTTTPVFANQTAADGLGIDLISGTIDHSLWIALLAAPRQGVAPAQLIGDAKKAITTGPQGAAPLASIGIAPALALPDGIENAAMRPRTPVVWESSRVAGAQVDFLTMDRVVDTTKDLTRQGVMRVAMPTPEKFSAPTNNVRDDLLAGVGERPPRLDDPDKATRLVGWLRMRPSQPVTELRLSWVGLNAVEVDQFKTHSNKIAGISTGRSDQVIQLPATSVDAASLDLQVEEEGVGFRRWARVDDLMVAGRDDSVYVLDAEAGTVKFGDGVHGRIAPQNARVRVGVMRAGGGAAGNLPPQSLKSITAYDVTGALITQNLKVWQPLALTGGGNAETVFEAEKRIPSILRNHDRAVTASDFRELALSTPGVALGRVEMLEMFLPQQRRFDVPGVVTAMVLPFKAFPAPPNPRPDRALLEAVDGFLRPRKPLATELYVIGCEYVALGAGIGVTIKDGFDRDQTLNDIRDALRAVLWPLAPGGPSGAGWPLGRAVRDRELEIAVARIPAVESIAGVSIFRERNSRWQRIVPQGQQAATLTLEGWQLPELLSVVVSPDGVVPDDLTGVPNPFGNRKTFAVPVVPEIC